MKSDYERPDALRCKICGRYMEVAEAFNGGVIYECCNERKTVPLPSVSFGMNGF